MYKEIGTGFYRKLCCYPFSSVNGYPQIIFMCFVDCSLNERKIFPGASLLVFVKNNIPDLNKIRFMIQLIFYCVACTLFAFHFNEGTIITKILKLFRDIGR